MDKNFLIAIVITILVIMVYSSPQYQKLFGTERLPETVETVTPDSTRSAPAIQPVVVPQPVREVREQQPSAPDTVQVAASSQFQLDIPDERDVTIENDDLALTVSTRGGVITQAVMKNHPGLSPEEPAMLVTEGQNWCNGSVIDGDTFIPFDALVFDIITRSSGRVLMSAELSTGGKIVRELTIEPEGYLIHHETRCEGVWNDPQLTYTWHGPLNKTETKPRQLRIWPFSMMIRNETTLYSKMAYYGQVDRLMFNKNGGPALDSEGRQVTKTIYRKDGTQKIDVRKDRGMTDRFINGELDWFATRNKYFMSAAIPREPKRWAAAGEASQVAGEEGPEKWFDFSISKRVSDGDTGIDIYCGPIMYNILKNHDRNLTEIMELSWRFIRPLSILFLKIIKKLREFIPNWGLVIILFSIIIKTVLHPLSKKSMDSMRKMSSLQPQITELKEKYKNNQQKQHQAMMALYKEQGVNPLGGCLPLVLQMPVFFALYPVVGRAFELRQAMFIPYWIEDLSRPDPFYILPVGLGISTFLQSQATMKDPNQKAMLYMMPVMMVILFANFSSGVCLYWFMFNIMTFAQQTLWKPS